MLENAVDFLGYMLFSSLEYFTIFFLIFALFNLYPSYYKKELLVITLLITLMSYLLVLTNVYKIVPIFVFTMPLISLSLYKILGNKLFHSVVITTIATFLYGIFQTCISALFISSSFLTLDSLTDPFSFKTYFMQSLCAFIGIAVAMVITLTRSGFGFSFSKGSYFIFSVITVILLVGISLMYYLIIYDRSLKMIYTSLFGLFASFLILLYFSYKRDNYEYK